MSALASRPPTAAAGIPGPAALSPVDLAEFISSFNDAAARLQATHEALHEEVRSLKAELNEAKEQVDRSRRLAALGEMAAGIAHEIRNPLGSIGLYARMLQQDLTQMPEQSGVARKISDAVSRLNAVVGDVLTFARELRLRPTRVCAGELLSDALDSARGDPSLWTRVETRWASPRNEAPHVECDPLLVHQALLNVIRNALEAMSDLPPEAPRVLTLDARIRRARDPRGGAEPMICLSVRDTGPGIPTDVMERMFNPFFTTRAAGTGLGLAIVHRIMDAHGGRAAVRNARPTSPAHPSGAVVELLLPARVAT
ncbi:MAG: sensor histidine kinase [Phycisphaerales bacterium]